jgi:hypothetical protein
VRKAFSEGCVRRRGDVRVCFFLFVPFAGADVAVACLGDVEVVLGPDLGDLRGGRG